MRKQQEYKYNIKVSMVQYHNPKREKRWGERETGRKGDRNN